MTATEARAWLDREWNEAIATNDTRGDPVIDNLANSSVVSIRYALITQILGKIADSRRSLHSVQLADGSGGAWDARSFSRSVVVPWVADNHHVIGTSAEPYASKPLRRLRIERNMPDVQRQEEWNALVDLLDDLEKGDGEYVKGVFRRVLRSLVRRLATQKFGYAIPPRISLRAVEQLTDAFLSEASGGLRPLAVTTSVMCIAGEALSLFSKVEAQGINESDAAGGVPGDVVCYCADDREKVCLVVEVKDMLLTLGHVDAASIKAKRADIGLSNILLAARGVSEADAEGIDSRIATEWASGMNIYTITIPELIHALFVLMGEDWRVRLLREIGDELDRRQDQPSRKAWHDLLLETNRGVT